MGSVASAVTVNKREDKGTLQQPLVKKLQFCKKQWMGLPSAHLVKNIATASNLVAVHPSFKRKGSTTSHSACA